MKDYYERVIIQSRHNLDDRDFWVKKLSGNIQKSFFPYDFKEINDKGMKYDEIELIFPLELEEKLISASKGSDQALHMILLAVLVLLLAKYSYRSNKDILTGSFIYKQKTTGDFINLLLPLRVGMDDGMTFKDLLLEVKHTVVEAVQHQNYPVIIFSWELDMESKTTLQEDFDFPLFDTFIYLENVHEHQRIKHLLLNTVFSFNRIDNSLTGKLKYNTRRYKRSTVKRIAHHFITLLTKALFNSRLKLTELDLLDEKEKSHLLYKMNRPDEGNGNIENKTLSELFTEQVMQTPFNHAVTGPGLDSTGNLVDLDKATLTYEELDGRSTRLANVLRSKGIQRNSAVAICLKRSIEMVVGIIAILKAGGAYLPIEPGIPYDRMSYILTESGTSVLLTTRYLNEWNKKNGMSKYSSENIFIEEHLDSPQAKLLPNYNPLQSDLAYIIYTSGTTGRPKGVLVEHRNVANYVGWRLEAYGITEQDVTLQLLSFAFDAFAANFYSSLFSGGLLVMMPESKKMDYEYIRSVVRDEQVTNLSLVPAMYEALIDNAQPKDIKGLRFVVLGGEEASNNLIKRSRELNPQIQHIIEYGPTEATICTVANIGISPKDTSIIGQSISNIQHYILDQFLHPQPIGVPGELYIVGDGVSRGYLNNPELSAERFMRPPSAKGYYKEIYKTGDLACWLPNGTIELLGRIDQQVKIRGFRVEIEEVENLLLQHQDIAQCFVIPRESNSGSELELVAYYKKQSNTKTTTTEICEFLAKKLPDYMRPNPIIEVDEFPLTPNGKIDHMALAETGKLASETEWLKPCNEIEKRISEVFKQVIDVEEIGVNSGFFDIGGTSIKAIFAQAQLSKEFNISVDHFYQYRNIQEMAKAITWKKDALAIKIQELKQSLNTNTGKPGMNNIWVKNIKKLHMEYMDKIKSENLPDFISERDYRHIFLTGVTGYIGSHLVYEILKTTETKLHVLVRADTPQEGEERLKRILDEYFGEGFFKTNSHRLQLILGDIRGEHMGMDDTVYNDLVGILDSVIHAAADNREFGMYEDFHKVNVNGLENLIELVKDGREKDLHYISTLEIAPEDIENSQGIIFSEYSLDIGQIHTDRIRSKLEAEKKVFAFRENGGNASIYRVGNPTIHSKTRKIRKNIEKDKFFVQMKSFIELGMIPEYEGLIFKPCHIDNIATSIVKLMNRRNLENQTYHLCNTFELTWKDIKTLIHASGIDIKTVRIEQFLDRLMDYSSDDKYIPAIFQLLRFRGFLKEKSENGDLRAPVQIVSDRTERILKQLGFQWEKVNESHIGELILYCQKQEFIQ